MLKIESQGIHKLEFTFEEGSEDIEYYFRLENGQQYFLSEFMRTDEKSDLKNEHQIDAMLGLGFFLGVGIRLEDEEHVEVYYITEED